MKPSPDVLTLRGLGKSLLGLQSPRSLILQPLVILEERHQGLGLLPHVEALVLVILGELEILQSLNCKYVLLALLGNLKEGNGLISSSDVKIHCLINYAAKMT